VNKAGMGMAAVLLVSGLAAAQAQAAPAARARGVDPQIAAAVRKVSAVQIEANIDDMNPEYFGYVFERLFAAGALDVWTSPIVGKKGRPANIIGILGPVSAEMALRDVVLTETSSIGIRVTPVRRWILDREWVQVTVEGMAVRVKVARDGGRVVNISPEYSDCEAVARETGIPLKEVFRLALGSLRL